MGDKTKIAWTDATWNTVVGCSKVSPGCRECYAEKLLATRMKHMSLYGEIRSIRDQCREADVACFVKQLGSNPIIRDRFDVSDSLFALLDASGWDENHGPPRLGHRSWADPSEWPEDLRVREYPR